MVPSRVRATNAANSKWGATLNEETFQTRHSDARGESSYLSSARDCQAVTDAHPEPFRLDVPRRGHVLSTAAETYGRPLREAVAILSDSLAKSRQCAQVHEASFGPPRWQPSPDMVRPQAELGAWSIVSMWVVAVASEEIETAASLADAEQWFAGSQRAERVTGLASDRAIEGAETLLRSAANPSAFRDLLPYLLDPHGPGSRLSIRRDPSTRATRARKRAEGVFYTPADVAEYMVAACLDTADRREPASILDPACGTGVFLRAALKELRRRYPDRRTAALASECLFGTDIDPWPLDAAAFVLLADSWKDWRDECLSPAAVWRQLRLNFACIDTLQIDPAQGARGTQTICGVDYTAANEFVVRRRDSAERQDEAARVCLSQLFPALKQGPRVIVGNPPYAELGYRCDFAALGRVFKTVAAKPQANAEIYLPFVEQMTRLSNEESCAGALVLPLSIAYNVDQQFTAARRLISETPGHWRFAFFDREPHALFGEDVKTRNAILLWSRTSSDRKSILATGPLRKWRGNSRAAMFRSLHFTTIDGNIRAGIPKLDGSCQAVALNILGTRLSCLEQAVRNITRRNLAEVPHADDRTVFVGPTAYNFLNVFLRPPCELPIPVGKLSEHPLHAVECGSHDDALVVFAILTSHLAYWWWHAHGDGFHVSKRFIATLPFGPEVLTGSRLAACGADLWSKIKTNPIVSLNRNRTSLAYTPNGHDDLRRKVDLVLAEVAGLASTFVAELQQFTTHTVAATLHEHAAKQIGKEGV